MVYSYAQNVAMFMLAGDEESGLTLIEAAWFGTSVRAFAIPAVRKLTGKHS